MSIGIEDVLQWQENQVGSVWEGRGQQSMKYPTRLVLR